MAVVDLLLAYGAIAVNQDRTDDGSTALHMAAYEGYLAIAQLLVVFGADMTATDSEGNTPLLYPQRVDGVRGVCVHGMSVNEP